MNPDDGLPGQYQTGKATMRLNDLKVRWGVLSAEVDSWKIAPTLIRVRAMDYIETWKLLPTPHDPPKTVGLNRYELIDKTKESNGET